MLLPLHERDGTIINITVTAGAIVCKVRYSEDNVNRCSSFIRRCSGMTLKCVGGVISGHVKREELDGSYYYDVYTEGFLSVLCDVRILFFKPF